MPRSAAVLLLLLADAMPAAAHAVLTRSSLEAAPVRADTPTVVTLRFNGAIEAALARVLLVDAAGQERRLEPLAADEPAELRVEVPALAPGTYGLRYKVLAADGHVTESVVRFTVGAR